MLPTVSRAADIHWNAADGAWDVAANWTGGVVPATGDRGIVDRAGGGVAHVTTDVPDVRGVSVANGNSISVETGGILTSGPNIAPDPDNNPADGIHIGDGGTGSATVSGGTLATAGGGYQGTITVGRGGATGTLTVNNETSLVDGNDVHIGGTGLPNPGNPDINSPGTGIVDLSAGRVNARAWSFVGRGGGTGTFNLSGTGSFATAGELSVGFQTGSTGTMNITGGQASAFKVVIGRGGAGNLTVNGGTISSEGQFDIGEGGGTANVTVTTGTLTKGGAGNDLAIGNGGNATVTQTGGTVQALSGWSFIGRSGSTGEYKISGGTFTHSGQLNTGFQAGSTGILTINGGGVAVNEEATFGRDGGSATATQTAGSFSTGFGFHVGRAGGPGSYTLSGGNLSVGTRPTSSTGHPDDRDMVIGADAGGPGTLTQTGGTIAVTKWGFVGRNNGSGTFNQSGGTYSSGGWMRVAEAPGAVGEYNLSGNAVSTIGGGDLDTGDDDLILAIDPLTSGTVTVRDNAVLNASRDIRLGLEGGNGTFVQSGNADVNVAGIINIGNNQSASTVPASGTFTVNGGTLDVGFDMNVGGGVNTSGQANITGGNTTVNGVIRVGDNGAGVLDQSGGTVTTAGVVISANPATSTGDYNLSGGRLTALTTTNNGTLDISNNASATLGAVGGTGSMTVAGTATVGADHVRQTSLAMTGGTITITETTRGTAAGVSRLGNYTLDGNSRYDLKDNKLVTDKPVGTFTGGAYTGVQGDVAKAYNFGAWDLPGLMTSKPDAGPLIGTTTIGVSDGASVLFLGPAETGMFAGQTVTGATTIAMYTYAGDVNFDGLVDAADYGVIDNWVQFPGTSGYANGDFNYDGVIDAGDYGIIDNTIQLQGEPFLGVNDTFASGGEGLAGVTAVPEPATLSVLGLGALGLLGRRRRTR